MRARAAAAPFTAEGAGGWAGALLAGAGVFMLVNTLALFGRLDDTRTLVPFAAWAACALAGWFTLARTTADRLPYALAMAMSGWGLLITARLLPEFGLRQALWLVVATAGFIALLRIARVLVWLRAYRYTLLVCSLLLIALTIVAGTNPSAIPGAPRLWISIGEAYVQPSEPLKLIMVAFLASYLAEQSPLLRARLPQRGWQRISPRTIGPLVLMWALSIVFLVLQRDLGAAMLFFIVFVVLVYVASGSRLVVVVGLGLVAIAAIGAYFAFSVVALRIDIWLNPWPEADGRAYQIVQSLMAIASGGIGGSGIGRGVPGFIPVAHSDFAFAALAEEWGLLSVVALLAMSAGFTSRGITIALRHERALFECLLAVGLTTLFAVQSLLIMGGVLKLIPLTGVTLPFVSYGGSSLVVNFALVGLLTRLSALASRDASGPA